MTTWRITCPRCGLARIGRAYDEAQRRDPASHPLGALVPCSRCRRSFQAHAGSKFVEEVI